MNRSSAVVHLKELGARNAPTRWGFKSGGARLEGLLLGWANVQGRRSGATLGHLPDRRKNVLDISTSEEVIRRYKRANIKKILKGGSKPGGSQGDGASVAECHREEPPHLMGPLIRVPRLEEKGTLGGEYKKGTYHPSIIRKSTPDGDTRGLHKRGEETAAPDEQVKDAVDKLFASREKRKNMMKRIVFKNCYDYLELIHKHEEERGKDDERYYNCLNGAGKNGYTLPMSEGKVQTEGESPLYGSTPPIDDGHLFEVENDASSDANVKVGLIPPEESPRMNVSIFSEAGRRDILESCKRRRNMQSEMNRNSDARNLFNRDVYFWLKRKVHRSVGWQLTAGGLRRGEEVVDVTELPCVRGEADVSGNNKVRSSVSGEEDVSGNTNVGRSVNGEEDVSGNTNVGRSVNGEEDGRVSSSVGRSVNGEADGSGNTNVRNMDRRTDGESAAPNVLGPGQGKDPPRGTYLQRRAAPLHFLSGLGEQGAHIQQSGHNSGQESGHNSGQENGQKSGQKSGHNSGQENGQKSGQENGQKSGQESPHNNLRGSNPSSEQTYREAYAGIVDSSANVFKQLRENYELFKEKDLSPTLLQSCEQFVGYYYGIEKEQKVKELQKYKEMNFYEMVKEGSFTIDDYNGLLKSQILFNKEEEAFRNFNLFKRHDIKVNTETYNCLMYASIVKRNAKLGRLIYLQMVKDAVAPNKNTYCILMKAHILDSDLRSAFHLYRKMLKEDVEVDLPIYSTLIDGLIKHKHYERAESFFNYVVNYRNVTPDEVLYTIMIKKCAYKGEAEKCLNFYHAMISNHMKVTDVTLIEVIHCLSKRRDYFSQVFHFYNVYLANEMRVNHRVVLYLIVACSSTGNVKRLKEVLKSANRHRVRVTEEMCCYVIRTFANDCRREGATLAERHNNVRWAWAVVHELVRRGQAAAGRAVAGAAAASATSAGGGAAKSASVSTAHLGGTPLPGGTKLLNSIVQLYIHCDFHDYAISMLKYFARFECLPDAHTFGLLYRLLFHKMKDYGRVLCLYDYMVNQTEVRADEKTLNLILRAAIKTKSSKNTLHILRQMYAANVYPTAKTIKELFHVGRHITEIQLLINSLIKKQKRETYEENAKESQLIQLNVDEYELKLFREGKTLKTKSQLDLVREQFFRRKERVEKDKRMSKGKKSSDWLPYGQYLQRKRRGGDAYARRVDRPRPIPLG
ncbi:unnamed protein product [Plasmodium vivax]|uniref:(malaria parasite P. vivax) hypothetical protein n=1 Tax=Plasmodium vivax TaxID=5855 RepID=A0A8S4H4W0_PLAVI|nr:unnamed protein product [Plasmodium vivax]